MFAHSRRKKRKKSRKFEWKLRGVDRRSVEVKTCLTVRRETANGRSNPTSSTRHSVPVSHAALLIGVPCKLVACVREFRWYIRTYARTHRSKSEKERQREGERRETRKEGADSAHDTHVYTRKANSNDGHVYSMRTVHFVHVHTLYTLARFHVPHIDSVAARTLLHARARMEYERERERSLI